MKTTAGAKNRWQQIPRRDPRQVPSGSPTGKSARCDMPNSPGSLGRLAEIEDRSGGQGDGGAAPIHVLVALQVRVLEDLDHPVDPFAKLIGGRAGPSAVNRTEREQSNEGPDQARVILDHGRSSRS